MRYRCCSGNEPTNPSEGHLRALRTQVWSLTLEVCGLPIALEKGWASAVLQVPSLHSLHPHGPQERGQAPPRQVPQPGRCRTPWRGGVCGQVWSPGLCLGLERQQDQRWPQALVSSHLVSPPATGRAAPSGQHLLSRVSPLRVLCLWEDSPMTLHFRLVPSPRARPFLSLLSVHPQLCPLVLPHRTSLF